MPLKLLRLDAVLVQNTLHGRDRHVAEFCREFIAAPVCRAVGGFVLEVAVEHPRLKFARRLQLCASYVRRTYRSTEWATTTANPSKPKRLPSGSMRGVGAPLEELTAFGYPKGDKS